MLSSSTLQQQRPDDFDPRGFLPPSPDEARLERDLKARRWVRHSKATAQRTAPVDRLDSTLDGSRHRGPIECSAHPAFRRRRAPASPPAFGGTSASSKE